MTKALALLFDRPIAFNRAYVALGVGVTGALMLSQAVYWQQRCSSDGWFYKTVKEWTEETGLTRTEQESARARLEKLGVMSIVRRGVPARLFFCVDLQLLHDELVKLTTHANKIAGLPQSGAQDSSNQDSGNPADQTPQNLESIQSKTTNKTTAETTTDISTAGGTPPADPEVSMVLTAPNGTQYPIPAALRYPKPKSKTHRTWVAYAIAYMQQYGSWPLWNAAIAGQVAKFIERVGEDAAPRVALHYVRRVKEQFIVKQMHSFKLLLGEAEKWHTQALTGRTMTNTQAQQADNTESNANGAEAAGAVALAILANRRGGQGGGGEDAE